VPHGWWPSPLSAPAVAAGRVSRGGLHSDGSRFFWTESRPQEGGRQVVVTDTDGATPTDVTPASTSVRTRVHEYGGGAATTVGGLHVFVDQDDQRLYRLDPEGRAAVPLTPPSDPVGSTRWADPGPTPSGAWLICVEEQLEPSGASHRLVAVATDGSQRTVPLVEAGAFVSAPRVSPDGGRLAWVTWEHPAMPWDVSELWVAILTPSGSEIGLTDPHRVAGGGQRSVGQPRWCRDGDLLVIDEPTGWWLPYRIGSGDLDRTDPPSTPMAGPGSEFHAPDWVLGQSTLAEWPDGSVLARRHHHGLDQLVRLVPPAAGDAGAWTSVPVEQPCVAIDGVAVADATGRLAVLGSTPTHGSAVYELTVDGSAPPRELSALAPTLLLAADQVSPARPFVAETVAGPIPGLVYSPTSDRARGPAGAAPPLVVFCHGGPTGANRPGFDPLIQFFTSRGVAVAAVDYRGSSGYGRAYRQRLEGEWGIADVEDCTAYAVALAEAGRVDGSRMAIRGTSAGGLTALGALVAFDRFAGAASWYGVTDLESLAADTHEFESRYLDSLVGPLPEAVGEYRRRSPIHHADQITGSVLLLQGADDPVVPLDQARRFAEALLAGGVSCRLMVFEGESHGFRRADTIEASLTAELDFYRSIFDGAGRFDPR
jgi:dipeptidyl aminopeptidase/acylaminoacyl peptidase